MEEQNHGNEPVIVCIDVETSPLVAFSWGPMWKTNLIEIIKHTRIIGFSLRYLKGEHITKALPDYKGYKPNELDDKRMMKEIWHFLNGADIVLAHNGRAFDTKLINARLLYHGFPPPSPYKLIDTRLEFKKYIRLPSYSLNNICDYFGIGRKLEHEGFPLWKKCMVGDEKAWRKMKRYNTKDVILTEKLYLLLRPFMKTHPSVSVFTGTGIECPKCNSKNLQSRGMTRNKTTAYRRIFCKDCGGWSRTTKNLQEIKPLVSI